MFIRWPDPAPSSQANSTVVTIVSGYLCWFFACSSATACRQSRHRQSSKPVGLGSPGFGSGNLTSTWPHQHGPPRLQANACPQRAQASCRGPVFRCSAASAKFFAFYPIVNLISVRTRTYLFRPIASLLLSPCNVRGTGNAIGARSARCSDCSQPLRFWSAGRRVRRFRQRRIRSTRFRQS